MEAGRLRTQLNNLETQSVKLEGQITQTAEVLAQQEAAESRTETATERLSNQISQQENELADLKRQYSDAVLTYGKTSDEAQGLASQIKALSGELDDNRTALNYAEDAADQLDQTLRDSAAGGWSIVRQVAADLATNILQEAAGAMRDLAEESIEAAADVQAETSQFYQTFGELATSAESALGRVADSSGILDTRLQSVGTSIYSFAKTTGMDSAEALSMMERALTVTADSAAYYDRSLEDTTERLQSFLKGNYENDAALGLSCTETTRNAAANELYGKSFNDLSEAQKQLTLLKMVEDANALSGALGQASRETDGWANVTGNLKEAQRQFLAVVGQPILAAAVPIVQDLTSGFMSMSEAVKAASDWCKEHQTLVSTITIGIGGLTVAIGAYQAAQALANAGALAAGTIHAGQTAAITAHTVALGIQTVATTAATAATSAFAAVMAVATSPITLVVLAITALIAIGVALYQNWDTISAFAGQLWDNLAQIFEGICQSVSEKIQAVAATLSSIGKGIASTASGVWSGMKTTVVNAASNIYSSVSQRWNSIKSTTSSVFNSVRSTASSTWSGIKSSVSNAASNVYSSVSQRWNSIKSTTSSIFSSVRSTASSAWSSIKSTISSGASSALSTVTSKFNSIKSKISSIMNSAKSTVSSVISAIKSKFNFSWSLPKLKLPHVKITGKFSLMPPSVPKFSISWYKEGGILQAPTIFGASGNTLLGGGEAGPEAVAPIDVLQDYVATAVERTISSSMSGLAASIQALASRPIYLQVNGRTFALATAGDTDDVLGTRQVLAARGLCL